MIIFKRISLLFLPRLLPPEREGGQVRSSGTVKGMEETGNLFQDVIASLRQGLIVVDRKERVVAFNQAAQMLSGVLRDRAMGKHLVEVFGHKSALSELVRRVLREECTIEERGMLLFGEKEVPPRVSVTASPLIDEKGEANGVVLLMEDLSLATLLEEDAKNRERLAQMEVMAAGMAHELRNPLSGIKALAELVSRRTGQDEVKQYADGIAKEADRIVLILNQLIDLARGEEEKFSLVNLNKIVSEVLAACQGLAQEAGAKLASDLDVSLPDVLGQEGGLFQLFYNLVKNALEAGNQGQIVKAISRAVTDYRLMRGQDHRGKMAQVEIVDQGKGIPEEELDKIFTPFYTTKRAGTGLGLTICAGIVTEHQGTIQVISTPGKGTAVRVTLPLEPE